MVRDCIGREWQLGTVQVDYNLPERFDLEYIGADNQPHRPVMIHRAPFGSMERFIGILIEHFAGAFPLWLAPEQVRVLPISDKFSDYGQQGRGRAARRRASASRGDYRPEKIGDKIREAQLEKIPYMLVVGEKEQTAGTVAVRDRVDGDLGAMSVAELVKRLADEVKERRIRQVSTASAGLDRQRRTSSRIDGGGGTSRPPCRCERASPAAPAVGNLPGAGCPTPSPDTGSCHRPRTRAGSRDSRRSPRRLSDDESLVPWQLPIF